MYKGEVRIVLIQSLNPNTIANDCHGDVVFVLMQLSGYTQQCL